MQSIKVHSVTGDVRPVNAISVWDASSTGKRPVDSIPVWDDTNDGDKPLNAIQVKLVGDEPSAIKVWFKGDEPEPFDPYNPLGLPPYTIRLKYKQGTTPTFSKGTGTLVDEENNIWDLTYENSDWTNLLKSDDDINNVLGANTKNVTNMSGLFHWSDHLIDTIPLFDTSKVTNMDYMFCDTDIREVPLFDTSNVTSMAGTFADTHITAVPLFNTSKVTNMSHMLINTNISAVPLLDTHNVVDMQHMFCHTHITSYPQFDTSNVTSMWRTFWNCKQLEHITLLNTDKVTVVHEMFCDCVNVNSGITSFYNQLSTQSIPPTYHDDAFKNCGISSVQGAAELAQIPQDWGGTKS